MNDTLYTEPQRGARRTQASLRAYDPELEVPRIDSEEQDQIEVLSDLAADLRHLCDALGLDHGVIQDRAHAAYLGDIAEEGPAKSADLEPPSAEVEAAIDREADHAAKSALDARNAEVAS